MEAEGSTARQVIVPLFLSQHLRNGGRLSFWCAMLCRAEFEQQLLAQSTLNPGLSRFLGEVLSVDENNEIYEVPVRGNETIRIVECTFDEVLVTCRNEGVLLLAIDQGGAPGADCSYGGGRTQPSGNRSLCEDREYQWRTVRPPDR